MRRLGGTDVGPVLSLYRPELAPELAKYANATDVAMRLIYNIERPRTAVMSRGIDAEPRLRRAYLDAYGGILEERERPWIVAHPTLPWATCSPDDVGTQAGNSLRTLVEYKSTSVFARSKWGEPDTDEIPSLYNLQVQWCMEILDLPTADVFVGFGRDFKDEHGAPQFLYESTARYVVPRDRELADLAIELCQQFQTEFVEQKRLPPIPPVNNKLKWKALIEGGGDASAA